MTYKYISTVLNGITYMDPQTLYDNLPYPEGDPAMIFYSDIIDLSTIYDVEGESKLFNEFLTYILHMIKLIFRNEVINIINM